MDLSIIIINFNTKSMTLQAIKSCIISIENDDLNAEIIILDNSSDLSQKIRYHNKYVKVYNIPNKGFAHACNIGAEKAIGKYLIFLNSDTIVEAHTFKLVLNKMKSDDKIGILGPKIVLENGELDHGCKRGFPTPFNSLCYFLKLNKTKLKKFDGYCLSYLSSNENHLVDAVSGAFFMIEKELFLNVGKFDETYFMYGEDLDLCYRVKEKGYKILYFSETQIIHLHGQSGLNTNSKKVVGYFYNAMNIFYDKHYKDKNLKIVTWLIHLAIKIKYKIALKKGK